MPLEKKPADPVPEGHGAEDGTPHRVRDGESWLTIAEKYRIGVKKLIYANFKTLDPREINWYLKRRVGCKKTTRDRKNWVFSSSASPGIVYIPPKVIEMPAVTIVGTGWRKMSFWIELTTGDLWAYKKVRGVVGMRIDHHPTDWYAWDISASLACVNVPIKGSPPIGVGSVNSEEQTFEYNPALIDPAEDWKQKGVYVRLRGDYAWIRVKDALPKTPDQDYQPIKGVTTRDLIFKVRVDSPQTGWCSGLGGIEDGRKVKPNPKKRQSYPRPHGVPDWT